MGILQCFFPPRAAGAVVPDQDATAQDDMAHVKSGGLYAASREPTFYSRPDSPSGKGYQHSHGQSSTPNRSKRASDSGQGSRAVPSPVNTGRRASSGKPPCVTEVGDKQAHRTWMGMELGFLTGKKGGRSITGKSDGGDVAPRIQNSTTQSTVESLERRGFVVHLAKEIHKSVSTSTSKPIAVLGMEPGTDLAHAQAEALELLALEEEHHHHHHHHHHHSTEDRDSSNLKRNHNKLFPLYVNGVAKQYFKIAASRDYAQVLRRLLRRDPLLTFALQKAIKNLRLGECKPVSHVTSDPTAASASLYGLRITPCVWADCNNVKIPALLLEHNVGYDPQDVMPRLLRDYAVLSHVPSILTLIDFSGHVLYQNAASLDYMGDLTSHAIETSVQAAAGMLGVLFQHEVPLLQEMLQEVLEGNYWQQVLRVPASLKRLLQFDSEIVVQDKRPEASAGSVATRQKRLKAAVSKRFLQDVMEPEFQLDSFTTQEARDKRGTNNQRRNLFQQQPSLLMRDLSPQPGTSPQNSNINIGANGSTSTANGSQYSNGHVAFHLPGPTAQSPLLRDLSSHEPSSFTHPSPNGLQKHNSAGPGNPHRRFMSLMQSAQPQQSFTSTAGSSGTDTDAGQPSRSHTEDCWHDVSAIPLLDPVLDKQVILLLQSNVTARVELENRLADLTDAQLGMLEQLFPRHVIEYMLSHKSGMGGRNLTHLANTHEEVMVLFTDVVGFTSMSKEVEPGAVMHFLNDLYTIFDDLVDEYDLYKLDTVGDCYIVVAGLTMQDQDGFTCTVQGDNEQPTERLQNAQMLMDFAKAMLKESKRVLMPHNNQPVAIRVGIHCGALASGLVGPKMPKFTLFGDTMNTASRMESTCKPGCVQVSDTFAKMLPLEDWVDTGGVEVKGKGRMQTYLWVLPPITTVPTLPKLTVTTMKAGGLAMSAELDTSLPSRSKSRDGGVISEQALAQRDTGAVRRASQFVSKSRPMTAASLSSTGGRSFSTRRRSFNTTNGSNQPLITILNALRGSQTGELDDELDTPGRISEHVDSEFDHL